jgi:pentatricopeptide repeat protein
MVKPSSQRGASIEALKEKMGRDPFSRAFLQLAEEYRKEGQYAEAVRVCQEGLARHPAYHTARILLGRTYLEAGDLGEARRSLSEVLELAPENHLAAKLLAEVQRKMGDTRGAAETYRAMLSHYPGDREVEALLQDLVKAGAGGPAEPPGPPVAAGAARPLRDVAPAPPSGSPADADLPEEQPDALQTNTLAELYLRQGLVERALDVYREMRRVDPGNTRASRRLEELTRGFPHSRPPEPSAAPPPGEPAWAAPTGAFGPDQARPPAGALTGAPRGAANPKIERLERWLRLIRAGSGRSAAAR